MAVASNLVPGEFHSVQSVTMGKKQGTKRTYEEDSDYSNDERDAELEAELAALAAMRNEKSGISTATSIPISSVPGGYNKEGLLQCLEALGTESLPFIESLQVSQFDLDVQDEHDDLEREVRFLVFHSYSNALFYRWCFITTLCKPCLLVAIN